MGALANKRSGDWESFFIRSLRIARGSYVDHVPLDSGRRSEVGSRRTLVTGPSHTFGPIIFRYSDGQTGVW